MPATSIYKPLLLTTLLVFSGAALAVDSDGDGVDDSVDAFPSDAAAAVDTDHDGKPDSFLFDPPENFDAITGWIPSGWSSSNTGITVYKTTEYSHSGALSILIMGVGSFLQTPNVAMGSNISFWHRSDANNSCLNFYLDGVLKAQPVLTTSWVQYSTAVTQGYHVVRWVNPCGLGHLAPSVFIDDVDFGGGSTPLILDLDDDNDGVVDTADSFPLNANESLDTDNDGVGNNTDNDDDGDGVVDVSDNCPLNANTNQADTDGDGLPNACTDTDDDNDGVADSSDKFPLNAAASLDTDLDGFPDSWNANCDITCQANSGLALDNCPSNANDSQADDDGDGFGNLCDSDGPGKVDTLFVPGAAVNNNVFATARQSDGKIVIGGDFINRVARLNADGSPDVGFNPGSGANGSVKTIILQADGKLVMGGDFTTVNGVANNRIARLNADGSLDPSFNPGSGANSYVYTIALQVDGKIVLGGDFTTVNGVANNRIARLNADGSLDTSFNPGSGANNDVLTSFLQTDGKIVIGGFFDVVNGVARRRIARLNADGSLDTSFNPGSSGVNSDVMAIDLQADGKIVIGGSFISVNAITRNKIARLNVDGSLDESFNSGSGANSSVKTITVQADGKIVIGGTFTTVNGVSRNHIARLNMDGSLDTNFNPGSGVNSNVFTIALQADGKIVIGGAFTTVNGITRNRIARLHSGDADQDGIEDAADKFSLDSTEWHDTDNDGIGNNADVDDDNDGIPDTWELQYGFNPLVNDASGDFDGDGLTNAQEYSNGSNPIIARTAKNDYNHDGIAGWIWKGQSNGVETQSQIWQLTLPLQSANFTAPVRSYPPIFPDQANWEIVTTGDFNKDGDADILWRNLATAEWKVWQMQNGTRVAQTNWSDAFDPAHEWTVVGAGDTDKDGDDDIILNKVSTGDVLVWEMQNHVVAATHAVGTKSGYTLNRIGDFNKDGDVDLLFRQNGADALITWEIETNAFVQERTLNSTGAGYNPVCAGDFDNDGDDDIMLVNITTQQEKWFVMENYTRSQRLGSFNTGFVFLGCGDYDGDGDADSLWQRSADDKNRVVLQQDYGTIKQTVYTNAFGGVNGFVYRGNSN